MTDADERRIYQYTLGPEEYLPHLPYRPFVSNTGQLAWLTRAQNNSVQLVAVSPKGQLVLRVCLHSSGDEMPAPSVRLLATRDHFFHWVGFFSDSHFWLLLPTGERIVLDLDRAQLLPTLTQELELRLLAAEKEWTLARLDRTPTGVCLHQHEEAALILNARHGWKSRIPWLPQRLEKIRHSTGGSQCFDIPGECMVSSKGAGLLKLFHYAHGGAPSDITSYQFHAKKGSLPMPKMAASPGQLQQGLTPRDVLKKAGCPDWIDWGGSTWDYYYPLPDGSVAGTSVQWGPEDKMRALDRVQMGGIEVAERANLMIAPAGLLGARNPPRILEIRSFS